MTRAGSSLFIFTSFGRGQRYNGNHRGTTSGAAPYCQFAAEQRHSLTHARQAYPLARSAHFQCCLRIEATSRIEDLEAKPLVPMHQHDARLVGSGVLAYVGEGLLGNPVERGFHFGGRAKLFQILFVCDVPACGPQRLDVLPDRGGETEVVERSGPQSSGHAPGLRHRLPGYLQNAVQVTFAHGRTGRVVVREVLQKLMGGNSYLSKPVMHLVCDPAALLLLRRDQLADKLFEPALAFGQLAVEPPVLQGAGRLDGEAVKYRRVKQGARAV